MKQAVSSRDGRAGELRLMVDALGSDDPAVRLYAIGALKRLTGETYGYRYYDDDDARKPAVDRWKQWLAAREAGRGPEPAGAGGTGK